MKAGPELDAAAGRAVGWEPVQFLTVPVPIYRRVSTDHAEFHEFAMAAVKAGLGWPTVDLFSGHVEEDPPEFIAVMDDDPVASVYPDGSGALVCRGIAALGDTPMEAAALAVVAAAEARKALDSKKPADPSA